MQCDLALAQACSRVAKPTSACCQPLTASATHRCWNYLMRLAAAVVNIVVGNSGLLRLAELHQSYNDSCTYLTFSIVSSLSALQAVLLTLVVFLQLFISRSAGDIVQRISRRNFYTICCDPLRLSHCQTDGLRHTIISLLHFLSGAHCMSSSGGAELFWSCTSVQNMHLFYSFVEVALPPGPSHQTLSGSTLGRSCGQLRATSSPGLVFNRIRCFVPFGYLGFMLFR